MKGKSFEDLYDLSVELSTNNELPDWQRVIASEVKQAIDGMRKSYESNPGMRIVSPDLKG